MRVGVLMSGARKALLPRSWPDDITPSRLAGKCASQQTTKGPAGAQYVSCQEMLALMTHQGLLGFQGVLIADEILRPFSSISMLEAYEGHALFM